MVPLVILIDADDGTGPFLAIGILAGVGAGAFSVPSAREVQLIRLTGGHDVGRGSRLVRVIVAPLVGLTGVCSAVEAILPLRAELFTSPVYALPLILPSPSRFSSRHCCRIRHIRRVSRNLSQAHTGCWPGQSSRRSPHPAESGRPHRLDSTAS